jgi:hypothetical protein
MPFDLMQLAKSQLPTDLLQSAVELAFGRHESTCKALDKLPQCKVQQSTTPSDGTTNHPHAKKILSMQTSWPVHSMHEF